MALYQKEIVMKQGTKSKKFFITEDISNPDLSKMVVKSSRYSSEVLKYPSCDTSKVLGGIIIDETIGKTSYI